MSEISTDAVAAELEDVVQSAEGLKSHGPSQSQTTSQQANAILGRLLMTVQKLNFLMQQQASVRISRVVVAPMDVTPSPATTPSLDNSDILNELDVWIQKIKLALSEIADFLKAAQYTIGVQFPFSIMVSITFTP